MRFLVLLSRIFLFIIFMKVVIISDIHDNLENLKKCLDWCRGKKIEKIICCGDVTNSESLQFLANNFLGGIHLVKGNVELYEEEELVGYKNINYSGRVGRVEFDNKKIGFCHEPYLISKVLEKGDCDIVFYGHTHRPWSEDQEGVKIINPGTLGGVFQRATFAFWQTEKDEPELKVLDVI